MENKEPIPQEEESNIITLTDEDGNEVPFEFLDLIPYQGREYVVLLPTDDDEDSQVVILELEGSDEDNDSFLTVSDPDVLDAVYEIFKDRFKDVFTFES